MNEIHLAYLSLGSNIQPERNLVKAIQRLQEHGETKRISSAWESESVGAEGPHYLNACVLYAARMNVVELKNQVLLPIEAELGRIRTENQFAPRTMDIDIIIFDGKSCDDKFWEQAFVVVPLAEIHPEAENPITREPIIETATRLRKDVWMETRRDVLRQFNGNRSTA